MLLMDKSSQRQAFAMKFPSKPDLKKKSITWTFAKYFGFPHDQRPLKAAYNGRRLAAREFVNSDMEKETIAALIEHLQPPKMYRLTSCCVQALASGRPAELS